MVTSSKKTLFLLLPALALAGCTAAAEPAPTAEPLDCDPATSTISWSPLSSADTGAYVPAGAQVVTYTDGGENRTVTAVDYELDTTFQQGAIQKLSGGDKDLAASWEEALFADLKTTGQVDEDFGTTPVISSSDVSAEPSEPIDGTFVIGIAATQRTATFTVDCSGSGETVEGSLEAFDGFGTSKVLVDCATAPVEPTYLTDDALKNCPAA